MLRWLLSIFVSRPVHVSNEWLSHHDRLSSRVDYHGPRLSFPIRKLANESSKWNARRLRRSA